MPVWYQQLVSPGARDPQSLDDIRSYGHELCKHFICRKLSKLNLIKPQDARPTSGGAKKASFGRRIASQGVSALSSLMLGAPPPGRRPPDALARLCDDFQTVATQLESMYPDLYKNVCAQMGVHIAWEQERVTAAYSQFAHALLHRGGAPEPRISWARIVALLCIASGLAVDCARNDKWATIPRIIDAFDALVTQLLAGWILEQSGWALPPELTSNQFSRTRRILLVCNACLAVLLVLVLLVLWRFY